MARLLGLVALTSVALALLGCASNDNRPRESSIPWNRPAKWEGPGVYGSAINQGY